MNDRSADVINQLFLDQLLAVEDAVENFADSQRRGGVLADDSEAGLKFSGGRIFQPEKVMRLVFFPKPAGLDGSQAMMGIVQAPRALPRLVRMPEAL